MQSAFVLSAQSAGITYEELIVSILRESLSRQHILCFFTSSQSGHIDVSSMNLEDAPKRGFTKYGPGNGGVLFNCSSTSGSTAPVPAIRENAVYSKYHYDIYSILNRHFPNLITGTDATCVFEQQHPVLEFP